MIKNDFDIAERVEGPEKADESAIGRSQTVCDIVMVLDGSLDELVGITGKRGQRSAPPVSVLLCAALFVLGVLIYDLTHPMVVFFRQ